MVGHLPLVLEVPCSIPACGEEVSVSKHAFSGVICRDDTRKVHGPLDREVNWMSPLKRRSPLVQVKEPYGNLDMVNYL